MMQVIMKKDQTLWFSMWFLASMVTFGAAFFLMFYRLVEGRNNHFRREAGLEKKIVNVLKKQGKKPPSTLGSFNEMNAKVWAASIILLFPVFALLYLLSRDLRIHEKRQDEFLAGAFSEKMFMTQTIPIRKYVLITIVTLGVGMVYWLYKIVNMYNAHFKAHWKFEKEILRLLEEKVIDKSM